MVLSVPINTYTVLQNATEDGLIVRDAIWMKGRNRETKAIEEFGIWSGAVTMSLPVYRPDTGAVVYRTYQAGAGLMTIPPIPSSMTLEVRSLRLTFARLTPAIINAVKVYNPRRQPLQIHRFFFDRETMKPVDPGHCRWDGTIQRTPIKRDKVNGTGIVEIETADHSRCLTQTNPQKMSAAFFEDRDDAAGRYIATIWRVPVPWGQSSIKIGDGDRPKEKFF